MPSLIGQKPNQVPTNGDLGTLAFQDANAVNITGGNATLGTATATTANVTTANITTANISGGVATLGTLTANSVNLRVDHDISNISPTLLLDFANTKVLDPRITFTRASTATFYDGRTVAKAEENLLLRSAEFDNLYWTKTRVTITANSVASPDGTTTADTLLETAVTDTHHISSLSTATISGATYVASVFVRANGRNFCALYEGVSAKGKYFDITAGGGGSVLGNLIAAPLGATLTYVGNDWYRISISYTASTQSVISLYLSETGSNFSYAGDITKGIYAWGAQLEQRSAVSAYTPTTTEPITNYIPALQTAAAGIARFDHNPLTGESLGLLIEEQRSNLFVRSEEFGTTWTQNNISVSSDTIVSPSGALTADKITESTANNEHNALQAVTVVANTAYTLSCYVKRGERSILALSPTAPGVANYYTWFDLNSGTVLDNTSGNTASITSVGNGWYRCSITRTTGASQTTINAKIGIANVNANASYTGDGYSGIYVWGAQLEAGAFPTSYIPTVASTVTRNADAASMTGVNFSSWYNAQQSTLYAECNRLISGGRIAMLDDGSTNNRFELRIVNNIPTLNSWTSNVQDVNATSGSSLGDPTSAFKSAGAIRVNDAAISNNGLTVGTDSSCLVPQNLNRMFIGSFQGASTFANGTIKKLAYFPLRLPNAELIEMTT